jgi:hypothetical protein
MNHRSQIGTLKRNETAPLMHMLMLKFGGTWSFLRTLQAGGTSRRGKYRVHAGVPRVKESNPRFTRTPPGVANFGMHIYVTEHRPQYMIKSCKYRCNQPHGSIASFPKLCFITRVIWQACCDTDPSIVNHRVSHFIFGKSLCESTVPK